MSGYAEAFSAAIQATIQTSMDLGAWVHEPSFLATSGLALGGLALAAFALGGRGQRTTAFDGLAAPRHAVPTGATPGALGPVEARIAGSTAEPGAQDVLGVTTPGGGE